MMTTYKLPDIPLTVVGRIGTLRRDGIWLAHGTISDIMLHANPHTGFDGEIHFELGLVKTRISSQDEYTLEVED